MKVIVTSNIESFRRDLDKARSQVPFATSVALNKAATKAQVAVQAEMRRVFDRPTPWVINSLRVVRATKTKLTAELAFKDAWSSSAGEVGGKTMIEPHVIGGSRAYKGMEVRLRRLGLLPDGWNAVPGGAAKLDPNGNMSAGQITQLLNVLGTYTEAGYNKANANTVKRLAKGNVKKNQYGFVYWVNPVARGAKGRHLQPGVYQRVTTGFGTSLKPVLIFVKRAKYRVRLDFYGIAQTVADKEFPIEFNKAFDEAIRTAIPKVQGALL